MLIAPLLHRGRRGPGLPDRLRARAGGHLVVGPRTGYGDGGGKCAHGASACRIAEAAGVWYDEMASLPSPVAVHGSLRGAATGFAEGLVASGAEVLASFQHPHLGRWATVTTKAAAARITVIANRPGSRPGRATWRGGRHACRGRVDHRRFSHRLHQHRHDTATRLTPHNWSWDEATASPSGMVTDMLGGERHTPGEKVTLRAWASGLFRSDETHDQDPGASANRTDPCPSIPPARAATGGRALCPAR